MKFKWALIWLVVISFFTSSLLFGGNSLVNAAEIDSIPNTTRNFKDYDNSFLSVTGYASLGINDRSQYIDTSYYRQVKTEREFLQAILDAGNGSVKVIEVAKDLNLGWKALNLSSEEAKKYRFIRNYKNPMNGFTNPNLASSG
ncbi:MAG: hypothetical protein K0S80_4112, partial [Neobacillus sp.]|nr:hypothetical protein [Neobacillus sp.]